VGTAIPTEPRSESLPRARIIRRRGIFDLTRNRGRRLNNRWMTLSVLALDPARPDPATVAFLTPKRLGPATIRNRLRRRMREIHRRHLASLAPGTYLVWIARPPAVELDFEALKKCMTELIVRKR
jgi:ribonuclease P protein component